MTPNIAFVICTEKGRLETESVLLVKTLRSFGGDLSGCDIWSFQPRVGTDITSATLKEFEKYQVKHINKSLNLAFHDYPFCNKIYACAYVESKGNYDFIVFLDSDQLIIREMTELLSFDYDLGLRPVEKKGIAASSVIDSNWPYWQGVFNLWDIREENLTKITTSLTNEEIYNYWNAGFIVFGAKKGLAKQWLDIFLHLMEIGNIPPQGKTFMDQVALAILSLRLSSDRVKILSEGYNFPLSEVRKVEADIAQKIVSIHYHRVFNEQHKNHPLEGIILDDQKLKVVVSELKSLGIYPKTIQYRLKQKVKRIFKG